MEIKINETLRIATDKLNYRIEELRSRRDRASKEEKPYWIPFAYYSSFGGLCTGLAEHLLRQSKATDVTQLKKDLQWIEDFVEKLKLIEVVQKKDESTKA